MSICNQGHGLSALHLRDEYYDDLMTESGHLVNTILLLLLSSEAKNLNNFHICIVSLVTEHLILQLLVTTSILTCNFCLLFLIINLASWKWSEFRIIERRCETEPVLAEGLIFKIVVCC